MEKQKLAVADFFHIEFKPDYLRRHWPRLAALLLLLLLLLLGAVLLMVRSTVSEPTVRVAVTIRKVCRLGGETIREQKVVREVSRSKAVLAPKEEVVLGLCDKHLYDTSVREESYGRSRFYENVAQIRAVAVEAEVYGKFKMLTEDQEAARLILVLQEKYPQAEHYDIRVERTHFDYDRAGVLIQKYE